MNFTPSAQVYQESIQPIPIPSAVAEKKVLTPLQGALHMAGRGLRITPLRSGTKIAFLPNWEKSATTGVVAINQWAVDYPDCNFGCVFKKGEFWGWDADTAGLGKKFKEETGTSLSTLAIGSRIDRGHYYFAASELSDKLLKNISQSDAVDFSIRHDDSYCVCPYSIHPDTKQSYVPVDRSPIAQAPDALIYWLLEYVERKKLEKAASKTIKSDASISRELIPHGQIHGFMLKLAGELRAKGLKPEEIEPVLLRKVHEECAPPIDDDKVRAMAYSIGNFPEGKLIDNSVLVGGKLAGSSMSVEVKEGSVSALMTKTANQITTRKINWLWEQRIPFGKLSVLAGNPDQGKSLVTMYMVSQLTTGRPLYGSTVALPACEVLIMAGEDEANDTIVPRLQAGDAELTKIHIVEAIAVKDGKGLTVSEREAQLDTDIQAIETMLQNNPEIRLVIVDPLSNYLGRANMNREQEVRQVLVPLKNLAARTSVAIVAVMHLNKNGDASAIHRIGGAVAFTGVARACWLFVEDPTDPKKHLMLRVKGNIAKRIGGLAYHIEAKPVVVEGNAEYQPYVEWIGETEQTASDVLVGGASAGRPAEKVLGAKEWLADFLFAGSQCASDVRQFGKKAGHSWATLRRAKEESNVRSVKQNNSWEWSLPKGLPDTTVGVDLDKR
jgi:archaellum biogenesis ATPase FlaH